LKEKPAHISADRQREAESGRKKAEIVRRR
jgi:hypothetical protein